MQRFKAASVGVATLEETNTFVVVLAEDEDGDGDGARLEIQRALTFDDQDRRLGEDTYCLCVETGATVYGGVRSWALTADQLRIDLSDDAAQELDVDGGFEVRLQLDQAQLADLRAGLERAFGG